MGLPKEESPLLTPPERRRARKKCIASDVTIHALGGLREPPRLMPGSVATQSPAVCVTAGAWSFLVSYLEYADFIAEPGFEPEDPPLFPHYFVDTAGRVPGPAEALSTGGLPVGGGCVLNTAAFFRAMVEDVGLWLTAFDAAVAARPGSAPGWFRATPVGLDPVNPVPFAEDMMRLLIRAYEHVLAVQAFPHIAAVEFPVLTCCDGADAYWPSQRHINGVALETTERDLLDFAGTGEGYVCGFLNPGNSFCIPGNGYSYLSVESMVGNNTDLRYVQSYIHNPYLMDRHRFQEVAACIV